MSVNENIFNFNIINNTNNLQEDLQLYYNLFHDGYWKHNNDFYITRENAEFYVYNTCHYLRNMLFDVKLNCTDDSVYKIIKSNIYNFIDNEIEIFIKEINNRDISLLYLCNKYTDRVHSNIKHILNIINVQK